MLRSIIVVAALAAATAASAAPVRLTDGQFIAANRCQALLASKALGGGDPTAIKDLLKRERLGRADYISQRASEAQIDADREARHANDARKAKLIAERDGLCQKFTLGAGAGVSNTIN